MTTLAELLHLTPDGFDQFGVPPEDRAALAAEPIYPDDLRAPTPGPDEVQDAFEWGRAVGVWSERYRIGQLGRLIAALQRRLGRRWVPC